MLRLRHALRTSQHNFTTSAIALTAKRSGPPPTVKQAKENNEIIYQAQKAKFAAKRAAELQEKAQIAGQKSTLNEQQNTRLELVHFHGHDISHLEKDFFAFGNLVEKLSYNEVDKKFYIRMAYKYEGYGWLNSNATETAEYRLTKKDIEYYGMLEDNLANYPSKRRTYYPMSKFHEWNKKLGPYIKYWKPEEGKKPYTDKSLAHVMIFKISTDAYQSQMVNPGYCLVPQRYSRINYGAMSQHVKGVDFGDDE